MLSYISLRALQLYRLPLHIPHHDAIRCRFRNVILYVDSARTWHVQNENSEQYLYSQPWGFLGNRPNTEEWCITHPVRLHCSIDNRRSEALVFGVWTSADTRAVRVRHVRVLQYEATYPVVSDWASLKPGSS